MTLTVLNVLRKKNRNTISYNKQKKAGVTSWTLWVINGNIFLFIWHSSPQWARTSPFTRFLDHTQRRTTVDRTPLDESLARRRDLTTHNHNRQTSMPRGGIRTHHLRYRPWGHQDRLMDTSRGCEYESRHLRLAVDKKLSSACRCTCPHGSGQKRVKFPPNLFRT